MILMGYGWARVMRDRVTAERRTLGTWVVAGDELHEEFTLVNNGVLPVLWAHVRDRSEVPGYSVDRVESVGGHAERRWTMAGLCQRRGVFRLGPWDLEMSDPLGFFRVTQHYSDVTTIMVYPRASYLPNLELPRGRAPGRSISPERSVEETIQVGGVRQYTAGDPLRRVHWPATAHHVDIMVREFDREPSGDLWLVVDLDAAVQAGAEAEATQEYAVILAASLAAQYLRQESARSGPADGGPQPSCCHPAGAPQLWHILAVAEAEPRRVCRLPVCSPRPDRPWAAGGRWRSSHHRRTAIGSRRCCR